MLQMFRQIVRVVVMQLVLLLFMMCCMLNRMQVEKIVMVSIEIVSIIVGSCSQILVIEFMISISMFMNSYLFRLEKLCLLIVVIVVIILKMIVVLLNVVMMSDVLFEKFRIMLISCDSISFMKNVKLSSSVIFRLLFLKCLMVQKKLKVIVMKMMNFISGLCFIRLKLVVILIYVLRMVGIMESVSS